MTRRRRVVLTIVAVLGITAVSLGAREIESEGGCSGCKTSVPQQQQQLDGGGDHHFPQNSDDISE